MTNNEDIDLDAPDDFEKEAPVAKPSLKEAWESNPLMKVAALAVGAAVLVGGYMFVFSGEEAVDKKAVLPSGNFSTVKDAPGQSELDEDYRAQIEKENVRVAEQAKQSGGSAIPTPIGQAKSQGLELPDMPTEEKEDPLKEWRKQAEARRMTVEEKVFEPEEAAPQPEVVPLVQPVRPQPAAVKQDPKVAEKLADQMRVIIAGHAPSKSAHAGVTEVKSEYTVLMEKIAKEEKEAEELGRASSVGSGGSDGAGGKDPRTAEKLKEKVIVPAGAVIYAQLMNELNSDVPGPVLVHVLSGPFAGARAIGEMSTKDEYIALTFSRLVKDGVTYKINAVALDEETTLAAHQTDVDYHYFSRIVLPAAAKFIEGYAAAVSETTTTVTTTSGGGTSQATPEPNANEEIMKGVEESAGVVSEILTANADRPITVKVAKGTTMGLFFVDTVMTGDADEGTGK